MSKREQKNTIYLDYASTTPVDAELLRVYKKISEQGWSNPSSPYRLGQKAKAFLDEARERAAKAIGCEFGQVIFTSGATEANNLAVRGTVERALRHDPRFSSGIRPKVIVSSIEHKSVLVPALALKAAGIIELELIPADRSGVADIKLLSDKLDERTILVSLMAVNNETGVIQPVQKAAEAISKHRELFRTGYPLLHCDAVQAFQYTDMDIAGIDLLTLGAHKLYSPRGSGILFARDRSKLVPQELGGGQEYELRSGTENVAAHYAFSKALERVARDRQKASAKVAELMEGLVGQALEIPGSSLVGGKNGRSPHITVFIFKKVLAEDILYLLDQNGISASSGSACTTGKIEISHVLSAMGFDRDDIRSSVRFSIGKDTTRGEITFAVRALSQAVARLRDKK